MHSRRHLRRTAVALVMSATACLPAARARGQATAPSPPCVATVLPSLPVVEDLTATRAAVAGDRECGSAATGWYVFGPAARILWANSLADARGTAASAPQVGFTSTLRAGLERRFGRLIVRLVPELEFIENADPSWTAALAGDPSRSPFASPHYHGAFSADLPERRGDGSHLRLIAGESGAWLALGRHTLAVTSGSPTWGPRAGEGLVLGHSAAGLPRAEVTLRMGESTSEFTVRWLGGIARESAWFDADDSNDFRAVSGLRAEYRMTSAATYTMGLARSVMSTGDRSLLAGLGGALTSRDSVIDFLSADFELEHAAHGTVAWAEVARQAPSAGVGEFLRMPTKGIALRLGLSQRLARTARAEWTASAEFTRLDQSGQRSDEVPQDMYTSPTVIQGWTHEGRPLGAGVGPGGQRQFARLDREGRVWHVGLLAERVRWNDDALLRGAAPSADRHDVTLQAGAVATRRWGGREVSASLLLGKRLDHHFRAGTDIGFVRLGLVVQPSVVARRIVGVSPRT